MSETLVERMARAIYATTHGESLSWSPMEHHTAISQALAALRAIRKPTEGMLDAWCAEMDRQSVAFDEDSPPTYPVKLWQAMIDFAIAEAEHKP